MNKKHLAGPKVKENPRQAEIEKKLMKAKRKQEKLAHGDNESITKEETFSMNEQIDEKSTRLSLKDLLRLKRAAE
jgi:hypothetical protein